MSTTRTGSVRCQGCGWAMWGVAPQTAEGLGRCPTCGDRRLQRPGFTSASIDDVADSRARWPSWVGSKGYL